MSNNVQKVAIYIRVSTKYQIEKDSLPLQRDELPRYAEVVLGITRYEIFEDAGFSAKNTDRPAFQEMMTGVRNGEFSHVLVWKIDRISRNLLDFSKMYQELKNCDVIFVSKNEQFDTSSAIGEAMLKIILIFAELERNMTSERVSAVMLARAEQGLWNGGKVPFGYSYDKATKEFTLNDLEADLVAFIFDSYLKEKSLIRVSRILNKKGELKRGYVWTVSSVSTMIKNPFYCGKVRYNCHTEVVGSSKRKITDPSEWIIVDGTHPSIVTVDEWDSVQKILFSQRRNQNPSYRRIHLHMFSNYLTCEKCGSNMVASCDRARADGWKPSIYGCSKKRRFMDCDSKYISDMVVGEFFLNFMANVINIQKTIAKNTTLSQFSQALLKGTMFSDILEIEANCLTEFFHLVKSGNRVTFFQEIQERSFDDDDVTIARDSLLTEKTKQERAEKRLTTAYLYADDTMSEKEYLAQKKEISEAISNIEKELTQFAIEETNDYDLSDEDFINQATLFLLQQQLQEEDHIDFKEFIKAADPQVIRNFAEAIVEKFFVDDGKIVGITFKNGLSLRFIYK